MYYRRKLLLGILEWFGGAMSHTKLQKVLFLVTRIQDAKSFDFVPYKYGCFSFQANQDLATLSKKGLVLNQSNANPEDSGSIWVLETEESFLHILKKEDQSAIKQTQSEIAEFSQQELIRYTYLKYPYFATKSQIAAELLSKKELFKVEAQKRQSDELSFFTIGYEGISLENYLNKLIINDIRLLCDVRNNPLSRKYGFSKSQLQRACESIGIKYHHIPDLGIDAGKRNGLRSINDYNRLFDEYEKTTLIENYEQLLDLLELVRKYRRLAITCFEKEPRMCHRSRIANSLKKLPGWDIPQKDL